MDHVAVVQRSRLAIEAADVLLVREHAEVLAQPPVFVADTLRERRALADGALERLGHGRRLDFEPRSTREIAIRAAQQDRDMAHAAPRSTAKRRCQLARYRSSHASASPMPRESSAYSRARPSDRARRMPASRSTRTCFDTAGRLMRGNADAIEPTLSSAPDHSSSTIARRVGSASASNASTCLARSDTRVTIGLQIIRPVRG